MIYYTKFFKGDGNIKIKAILTKPMVLLFLSAVLSALPLTFSNLFLLSWVSFIPLFYVLITKSGDKPRYAIARGLLYGFIYHICVYYWFIWFYPLDYVNLTKGASVAVVCLAWFGISVVHGVLWCIPFLCCCFVKKITHNKLFLSTTAIVGIIAAQKITALGELSFPWTRVSLGQYKATAIIQSVSVFGSDGLDMLILFVNAFLTLFIVYKNKKRILACAAALLLFFANLSFGIIRLNKPIQGKDFTIMTVQASIPQDEKWDSDGDKICLEAYTALTKKNFTDKVDLILWPESAVPKIYTSEKSLKPYKKLSQEFNTPILAGIILRSNKVNTNNTLLINGDGLKATYTKRQMVPFGEYMPYKALLSKLFPVLTNLNIIEDDYIAGTNANIMDVNGSKIGNVICFESIYPYLTRQSVLDGAELMVEATNDSWLETSPAMYQHLAHGVFRSVENGRYIIRSANSGISAVIDSRGNIKSHIDINKQGTITDTVQLYSQQTIYNKFGNLIFIIVLIITVICYLILAAKHIIKQKHKHKH